MRMSCNGCRVLRKGCSDDCSLRPCLEWIKTPESQANATVFLAKFYGRAGLMNLLNAGPEHLRPGKFYLLKHHPPPFLLKIFFFLFLATGLYLFFGFWLLVDDSHIQITALRGLWTNRESDIRIGGVAVVGELEPLPKRGGRSAGRIADHGSPLRYRRNPPYPSTQGLWHTPPVQGSKLSSWPSQGQNSEPIQAMRCSIQTPFGFGCWVLQPNPRRDVEPVFPRRLQPSAESRLLSDPTGDRQHVLCGNRGAFPGGDDSSPKTKPTSEIRRPNRGWVGTHSWLLSNLSPPRV